MTNIIGDRTTKEAVVSDYKNYPSTMSDLSEKPFYESRLAPIFYEIPFGSKVLDAGCNDGVFIHMLKEKRGCDVTGIDISETALALAKEKGLNVLNADIENLPFKDKTFDVVVCMEVLSHLFDPSKAVKEMRRVLKKNGILLGSCPHKNLETYVWEDKRMHRRYFDKSELNEILGESFERRYIRTLNGSQFSINMAHSFLAKEDAEMLFKCGHKNTLDWDAALQDRAILRCWMGFFQSPGTVYYRMSGFADKMQKLGAEIHYNPYNENILNSASEWSEKIKWVPAERRFVNQHIVEQVYSLWKAADISIWQITSSRDALLLLTTLRDPNNLHPLHPKKPLIVETDDWMFDLPSYNYASHPYRPNSESEHVAFDQLKLADAIICSTDYLKNKIAQLFPEKRVFVVKNSLDFDIWDKVTRPTELHDKTPGLIRMVYTGCGNHSGDLEIIKKPLLALLDEFPTLEFISLPFACFDDVNHPRLIKWNNWVGLSQFPQTIADWEPDFGIAPLRDNEFNRVKSNLRWLEYSALKIPTIASRVYPFEKSISNNREGLVVGNNAMEWYEAMKRLIVDERERTVMGQRAYVKVKKDFNMDDGAKWYLSILKLIKDEFISASSRNRKVA